MDTDPARFVDAGGELTNAHKWWRSLAERSTDVESRDEPAAETAGKR